MDARELEDRKIPYTPAFIRNTCTLAIKTPDADLHIYLCKYKYWGLPGSWLPEIPGTVLASSIRPVMEVEYDHS